MHASWYLVSLQICYDPLGELTLNLPRPHYLHLDGPALRIQCSGPAHAFNFFFFLICAYLQYLFGRACCVVWVNSLLSLQFQFEQISPYSFNMVSLSILVYWFICVLLASFPSKMVMSIEGGLY